ncbi:epidermal growth factor receptor substrate 15 [Chanos chanos]|uniref:Epidermal growth factor receptor substrate 15 n=1 Tax=Chanos chanos TaxID=29144 RepID=A0A6J2W7U7_CHACN|nr:epidermal growth factor receptor substrate 15 [Chanos chanos]
MAASLSLTQLSSGNPVYDKYYRQVDPSGSGRVAAGDAALFLKRSGLTDLILGKIWDLADSERKGFLNKQQFFVALRLVACAQNGLDVALKSLNAAVPPPKFHDTSSPLLPGGVPVDSPWVVKSEEKMKFDAIFDSLSPVGGLLSGEKVKPVLLNSKLPVDVLGRVWELSDIDRDGMLDRDEFAVAMHLVYRALESEPVPMSLPPSLVPLSKRRKSAPSPVLPLLPSPPSVKDRSSSHTGTKTLPTSPTAPAPVPVPVPAPSPQWVVSPADKAKYDEVFTKTDTDMDGLVSGPEVRDIFLNTGLPSTTLAHIWELCDIGDVGKLTREQFALALHLINQKITKGIDPPQTLSPEMIPPSDRATPRPGSTVPPQAADFSAIKELDSLSNEIVELQREKSSVEQEIKEKEESIRQRTSEVQDLQDEVEKESGELRRLQAERQEVQDALEKLDEQKKTLEEQLGVIRQQCSQESQLIQSLQAEHTEQEQKIGSYEEELCRAREELLRLQAEARELGEKVQAAHAQLTPLQDAVKESHSQISLVQDRVNMLQTEERNVSAQLAWKAQSPEQAGLVNGTAHAEEQPPEPPASEPQPQPQEQQQQPETKDEEDDEEQAETNEPMELRVTEEPPDQAEEPATGSPDEQEPKADPLGELYASAKSSAWPQEGAVREGSSPAPGTVTEVKEEKVENEEPSESNTPKVDSPEPEQKDESSQPAPTPPQPAPASLGGLDFFQSDPFTDGDPFKDDPFSNADVSDPFGGDPFKGTDPFAADSFFAPSSSAPFASSDPFGSADPFAASTGSAEPDLFSSQSSAAADPFKATGNAAAPDPFSSNPSSNSEPDPFGAKANPDSDPFSSQGTAGNDPFSSAGSDATNKDVTAVANDPFAPGGTAVNSGSDPDPFAAVFGNESFGEGFADFSALSKSNGADPFGSNNKNLFKEDSQPSSPDVPPALPPKTGTPTRPPPPPPGKRSNIFRSESSDSFQRRGKFSGAGEFSSLPAKDAVQDPFAPSSPSQAPRDHDRFASFDKYPTEEDMIEWAKRESEREERERVARLTQQEQEDLELAIALSKSELS